MKGKRYLKDGIRNIRAETKMINRILKDREECHFPVFGCVKQESINFLKSDDPPSPKVLRS